MEKIKKVSRVFRWLFQTVFYIAPFITAAYWFSFPASAMIMHYFPLPELPHVINGSTRIIGFTVSLLPTVIVMYGLNNLATLFKSYENGQIFTVKNVGYLKQLGYTLFAWVIGGWVYQALLSYTLSYQAAKLFKHHDMVQVIIQGTDATAFIVGGILILIAWVMDEACKIADEQAYTI